jgi:hypothetical protein
MDIRHCPNCGNDDIDISRGSKEYSSYVRYTCAGCSWSYQKGSGMGWYDTKGTHPRDLTSTDQSRLTDTGEFCTNCETVEVPPHRCTARELVEQADEPLEQGTVSDALADYHRNPERQMKSELDGGGVQLTPTFFRVIAWDREDVDGPYRAQPQEPAIADAIRHEVQEGGQMKMGELCDLLAAESNIEKSFVRTAVEHTEGVEWDAFTGVTPAE